LPHKSILDQGLMFSIWRRVSGCCPNAARYT
jgi:hypothetical protein